MNPNAKTQIHKNVNMSIVFRYLTQTVKMVGIGPADIVEGNKTLTLGLLYSIIGERSRFTLLQPSSNVDDFTPRFFCALVRRLAVFFVQKDIGDVMDMKLFKLKLLRWAQRLTAPYPGVEVTNLTTSFSGTCSLSGFGGGQPRI